MRKKTFHAIHLVTILLVISLRAFGQNDIPQVKIIHLGIGHGDCTLIILKDKDRNDNVQTITMLIDTGTFNPIPLRDEVMMRLRAEGADRLDFFVISHFHRDHMGAAAGFLQSLRPANPGDPEPNPWRTSMKIIDRSVFVNTDPTIPYRAWDLPATGSVTRYLDEVNNNYSNIGQRPEVRAGDDLFAGYNLMNAQMICIASDGVVGATRTAQPINPAATSLRARSENDLSFAFILRLGSFRYYTGGDLPGNDVAPVPGRPLSRQRGLQTNMEEPLANYLRANLLLNPALNTGEAFHACVFKVNHHGSRHSTETPFLRYFNPRIGVFTANHRRFGSGRLPSFQAVNRILTHPYPTGNLVPNLLYTFRFSNQIDPTSQVVNRTKGRANAFQDIILFVREETDASLVNGQRPRIHLTRRERERSLFVPRTPELRHIVNDGARLRVSDIQCDRHPHGNRTLQYRLPATP